MAKINFRLVEAEDIPIVAGELRKADREELEASFGGEPVETLKEAVRASELAVSAEIDGKVAFLWGVKRMSALGGACIWLVGTDDITRAQFDFLRKSIKIIEALRLEYGFLENWVDARNTLSIKWLRWLGFTLEKPKPFGVLGLPFHHFYK